MAEKKAPAAAADAEAAAAAGKRKKKLLLIGGGVAALLVIGIVIAVLLLGGKGNDEADEEEAALKEKPAPALYVQLGAKFVVTLPAEGQAKAHYLQVALSAMTHAQEVVEELEFNAPLVRDRVNSLLARQDFERLRTPEGKTALQAEILATLQGILATEAEQASKTAAHEPEEEEDEDAKPAKKKSKKTAEPEAAKPGIEQVFFTEFVLQ